MNKYDEIMEKIIVTQEMRNRILSKIRQTEYTLNNRALHKTSFGKYMAIAACLVIVIICTVPNLNNKQDLVYQPHEGIVEAESIDELSTYVSFPVSEISSLPFTATEVIYSAYWGEMAEISYTGEGQDLFYRKSTGTDDNSGDYNNYEFEIQEVIKDFPVTLKGDGELYYVAVWNDGQYSYSIRTTGGLSKDGLMEIIKNLDW